jgi:hypothetical protein
MTLAGAALWVTGITFAFLSLGTFAVSLRATATHDIVAQLLCQLAAYSGGLFLLLRIYAPEASIRRFLGVRPTHPAFYLLAPLLGVALVLPANLLFEASHRLFPQLDRANELAELFFEAGWGKRVAIGAAVVVAGPVIEEVVFRGGLHAPLLRSYRPAVVVVGTSVLFALVHLDPHAMVPILIVGLALGLLRSVSGSLWPALLMHAAFNAVPLVSLATAAEAPNPNEPFAPPWAATGVALAVCVGLLWAVLQVSRTPAARIARGHDAGG